MGKKLIVLEKRIVILLKIEGFQKRILGVLNRILFADSKNVNNEEKVFDQSRTQVGDESRILNKYGENILRMAYSYLHCRQDAEEILQDVLIQYLKVKPCFENAKHEKAWLLRVTANLSKNRMKFENLRKTDELTEELVAEEQEELAFVWEAVRMLPDRYRAVIHLHYYEGYTTKEISEILNRKDATVRSDLKRGRERLRVVLKEAYDFE